MLAVRCGVLKIKNIFIQQCINCSWAWQVAYPAMIVASYVVMEKMTVTGCCVDDLFSIVNSA